MKFSGQRGRVVVAAACVAAIFALAGLLLSPGGSREQFSRLIERGGESYALIGAVFAQGAGASPQAEAGPDRTIPVGDTVVLDGSGSTDPGRGELDFAWSFEALPMGSQATFSDPSAVKAAFQIDLPGTYLARLTVTDDYGVTSSDSVIVSTSNVAPVADAGRDFKAVPGDTALLDASGSSDFDGDSLSYRWTLIERPAGSAATLDDETLVRPSVLIDQNGRYVAELIVSDAGQSSAAARVTFGTENLAPMPEAGPAASAAVGQRVLIDPDGTTDADGDRLAARWSLIARPPGSLAALSSQSGGRLGLTPDLEGVYVVQVEANDGFEGAADTLAISTGNTPPVADAGPDQAIVPGAEVALDGAASSDANGDHLTYRWALLASPAGSAAVLDDPAAVRTRFTADLAGTYVAQLIVYDGTEFARADTVVVSTVNTPPVAVAGPDQTANAQGMSSLQLDGSASSDADGDPLSYRWALVLAQAGDHDEDEDDDGGGGGGFFGDEDDDSSARLLNPTSATPTLRLGGDDDDDDGDEDGAGLVLVQLIVGDGLAESAPDTVVVSGANSRPIAAAGADRVVLPGDLVQLDGGGSSDFDADPLTYRWALIAKPAGSAATLSDPAAIAPSFTADLPGAYVAQLIVSDGALDSRPDTVVAAILNQPPVADAGPDRVVPIPQGRLVTLDGGASSDPDGDPLSFVWILAAAPAGSTAALSGAETAMPSFVADLAGDYQVQLVVNDGIVDSAPADVTVTADANRPLAEAGPDQTITEGSLVALDGSASSDPEGRPLSYAWRFLFRPDGSTASLSDETAIAPSFTADQTGLYIAELTVSDGAFDSQPDTVAVRAGSSVGNSPPTLDPIGPQTVALGSTLRITLGGSDPDGDTLFFRASPVPLPGGASLDAMNGAFTFRPNASQVGDVAITFTVSDGLAGDSETVIVTVAPTQPGQPTALAGRVLDANANAAGLEVPVAGATIAILGVGGSTTTDAQGFFTLSGTPVGDRAIGINGGTASPAPDGSPYAFQREDVVLLAGVTNDRGTPFMLSRIDLSTSTAYNPASPTPTVVANAGLGARLEIAPGSARVGNNAFNGTFTLSEYPVSSAADILPPLFSPCRMLAIEPANAGVFFSPRASIALPNFDNLPPGTEVDIWLAAGRNGRFFRSGKGQVTAAGDEIFASQVITGPSLVFALPPAPKIVVAGDENGDNLTPTTLADGNLSTSFTLASTRSLGVDRAHTFVYNSAAAAPAPIVAAEVSVPSSSVRPPLLESSLEVGGVRVTGPVFTSTSTPNNPDDPGLATDERVRQALSFDASDMPAGSHPYRFVASAKYACSKVGAASAGRVIVDNRQASPFGAGWSLAELSRLEVQADGSAVIREGDGSTLRFLPEPSATTFEEDQFFPISAPVQGTVADLDGNGALDVAWASGGQGTVMVLLNEGEGRFRRAPEVLAGSPVDITPGLFFPDTADVDTGDFNGDGILDLAVANQDPSDRVTIHLGQGDGTFGLAVAFLPRSFATSVRVADFDRDGHDDVAIGQPGFSSNVTMYFGDGLGGFPRSQGVRLSRGPISLAVADFNQDGAPDLAAQAISVLTPGLIVALNRGDGTFFPAQSVGGGRLRINVHQLIEAGDLNGDGFPDIVGTGVNRLLIVLNNGAGGFIRPQALTAGVTNIGSVTLADINGDGVLDVTAPSFDTAQIGILIGRGDGTFEPARVVDLPRGVPETAVADFNGDGAPDIFAAGRFFFAKNLNSDRFIAPGADFSTLVRNADGSFTRRFKDGTLVEYNAAGLQTATEDRNGNRTTYAYDTEGRLTSITDPAGRASFFRYSGGQLVQVEDSALRATGFTLDANGNLVAITDVDGTTQRYAYDANNRMTEEISKRGFVTQHDYGFAGKFAGSGFPDGASISASIAKGLGLADLGIGLGTESNPAPYARPNETVDLVDAKGNPYKQRFNRYGSVVETTDPIGRTTVLERNADDLITTVVRPNDGELSDGTVPTTVRAELDYDALGNVTAQREAVGTPLERETTFEYEPVFSQVTRIIDPAGNPTTFDYDAKGNLLKETDALGGERISTYDTRGLKLTEQDPNGNVTAFAFDILGNLEKITDAEQNETVFGRDDRGNIIRQTEGFGTLAERARAFVYDTRNRVVQEIDGEGRITITRYDPAGNVAENQDPTGVLLTRNYDSRSRLVEESDPAFGPVTQTYDQNGNLETISTALPGQTVTLVYDGVNRIEKTTDPLGNERLFGYDAQDNVVSVKDARQVLVGTGATTFVFDPLNRQVRRTNALSESWTFAYDSRDNQTQTVDAKGQIIDRVYDELSRLTGVTLTETDGTTVEDTISITYDASGNRLTAKDGDSSLAFTYDALNRVKTASTLADPGTVQPATVLTSRYDAVGNRTRLAHGPNELVEEGAWTYSHDDVGRLTGLVSPISDPANPVALGYDLAGRLSQIAFPNQVVSDFLYDLTGRPEKITHRRGLSELTSFVYGYDVEGKITSIVESKGTRNFTYDATQQLTGGGFAAAPEFYAYDAEGSRTVSHLSASHSHDATNRLSADDTYTYSYDANGNLETRTETANGGETRYVWDVQNRLVGIVFPDGTSATYRYDPDGRRIEKAANGTSIRYVYDGDAILLEYDGANVRQARYAHGLEIDQPLLMERSGQDYAYHVDHQGSVRKLTNAAGLVANSYDTESFGRFDTLLESVSNPYAFTAREFDLESGLYFYRARYYDPVTGRFISDDPIGFEGNDLNLHRYVFNSPLNSIDPSGTYLLQKGYISPGEAAALLAAIGIINYVVIEIRESYGNPPKSGRCGRKDRLFNLTVALLDASAVALVVGGPKVGPAVAAGSLATLGFVLALNAVTEGLIRATPIPGVVTADPCR